MSVSIQTYCSRAGCATHSIDLDPHGQIKGPVGAGGHNRPRDVRTVQALLNGIAPWEGGPEKMLAVDGIVGPLTLGAINRFQRTNLGFNDGRVDPEGKTLRALREPPALTPPGRLSAAGGGTQPAAFADAAAKKNPHKPLPDPPGNFNKQETYVVRMMAALAAWPAAKACVDKVLQRLTVAISFAGPLPMQHTGADALLAFFDKHFRTGTKRGPALVNDLRAIEHVYRLINVVMEQRTGWFGGSPWGVHIFDIDRFPNMNPKNVLAYTGMGAMHIPSNKVDRRYNTPIMGSTIYLCSGADGMGPDLWMALVIHEIAHMVGSKSPASGINDYGYMHEKRYNTLGKWHRMHNAENYTVCALELSIGTKRLIGMSGNQDFLRAPVVADDGTLKN